MVPADSRRVSRVPRYSGSHWGVRAFVYRAITFYGPAFQPGSTSRSTPVMWSYNPRLPLRVTWFGLFRVRSPLLAESLVCFLFLRVLRWFTSPGSLRHPMDSDGDNGCSHPLGFPIRKSPDHGLFAAPRGLSQLATSFFACLRQGIHRTPLVA